MHNLKPLSADLQIYTSTIPDQGIFSFHALLYPTLTIQTTQRFPCRGHIQHLYESGYLHKKQIPTSKANAKKILFFSFDCQLGAKVPCTAKCQK